MKKVGMTFRILAVLFISIVSFGIFYFTAAAQDAGINVGTEAILAKLDQVLKNQEALMNDMGAMKEKLRIIEIRITQAQ